MVIGIPASIELTAEDGTRLNALLREHPHSDVAFVLAPGFTNHARTSSVRAVLDLFAEHGTAMTVDLRGQGRSGGRCTMGVDEVHDLAAATRLLRQRGYRSVVTIGFSLGAAVALRHAALSSPPDAVVAISAPARWWIRDTPAMRRLHWLLEQPHGRAVARLIGVRLGPEWRDSPLSPIELVGRIAPTPLLLVHGDADHYFSCSESEALAQASGHGHLWIERGMAHAESSVTSELVQRVCQWVDNYAGQL